MAAMSNYLENVLLDVIFRGRSRLINGKTLSWSAPPTYYVGLLTSAPSDSGGGTEVSTSATSYARVAVLCDYTKWEGSDALSTNTDSVGTNGTTRNIANVTFPTPSGNWGQVTHVGIYDESTGGNLLFWSALTAPKNINNGDAAPYYAPASFSIQIDN